jgi:hypothetical protein
MSKVDLTAVLLVGVGGVHRVRRRQVSPETANRGRPDSTAALQARNPAAAFGARGRADGVYRRPRQLVSVGAVRVA